LRICSNVRKLDSLQEPWLRFDAVLVVCMLVETEIVPPIILLSGSATDSTGILRKLTSTMRIFRLLRLIRLARLMNVSQEMSLVVKGIKAALPSVMATLALLSMILFIFSVFFRISLKEHQEDHLQWMFPNVITGMVNLLFYGTFLESPIEMFEDMDGHIWLQISFLFFIFLSCFTLMNLLVGVLCQVAYEVFQCAKEESEQTYLRIHLKGILECYDKHDNNMLGSKEFDLLLENPEVHETLVRFGTDIKTLASLRYKLFPDSRSSISFAQFFAVIIRLRGGHAAHVTDIVELREYITGAVLQQLDSLATSLKAIQADMLDWRAQSSKIKGEIQELS